MMTTTTTATTTKLLLHIKSGNSLTWKLLRICCVFATGGDRRRRHWRDNNHATCNVQLATCYALWQLATITFCLVFSAVCCYCFAGLLTTPKHTDKHTQTHTHTNHSLTHTRVLLCRHISLVVGQKELARERDESAWPKQLCKQFN